MKTYQKVFTGLCSVVAVVSVVAFSPATEAEATCTAGWSTNCSVSHANRTVNNVAERQGVVSAGRSDGGTGISATVNIRNGAGNTSSSGWQSSNDSSITTRTGWIRVTGTMTVTGQSQPGI